MSDGRCRLEVRHEVASRSFGPGLGSTSAFCPKGVFLEQQRWMSVGCAAPLSTAHGMNKYAIRCLGFGINLLGDSCHPGGGRHGTEEMVQMSVMTKSESSSCFVNQLSTILARE